MAQLSTLLVDPKIGNRSGFYLILAYSTDWSQYVEGTDSDKTPKYWYISFHGNLEAGHRQPIKCASKKEAVAQYNEVIREYMTTGWEDHTPGFYKGWDKDGEDTEE